MEGFDVFTERKMNVLVHLAKVDGDFHKSERKLIEEIAIEKGFDVHDFNLLREPNNPLDELGTIDDKAEMLYLSLKLIQVDDVIRNEEVSFCKELAIKLGYKPEVIDHYAHQPLPIREDFDKQLIKWANIC